MHEGILKAAAELAPLVATLRDGQDWEAAVNQVSDQIAMLPSEDAQALLFVAIATIAATPK